jgi:DNA-binding transcriptional LysR family regulator
MNIRHLKLFIAVEETGKMSAAAKKYFISQPSVSQAIKELENHYGVLLFERIGKKLYITKPGKYLLNQARIVVRQFDELEENMLSVGKKETLRIGSTITIGSCLLSSMIHDFNTKLPEIETFGYVNNTTIVEEKILKAELDIGIVEGQIKSHDLINQPIIRDYLVVACGKDHPFAGQKEISFKALENETFVMREEGSGTRELFQNSMDKKGIKLNIGWEVTSPDIIKTLIMKNNCLSTISVRLVKDEVKKGDIYILKNYEKSWDRSFNIVYHKNKHLNKAMLHFINIINQYNHSDTLNSISSGILI